MKKGIDVSTFQGNLTEEKWLEIKESGIEFAILRIGFTGYGKTKSKQIDNQFENNYAMCKKVGIPVGGYWYSCATSEEEAIEEAKYTLKFLEGKKLEYPVYIDTEDNHDIKKYSPESQFSIGKRRLTDVIKAYCSYIESKKYYVGIYASLSWLYNQLDLEKLTLYDKWVAQWAPNCIYEGSYGMWQYTNKGKVAGLVLDMNEGYYNFEKIIKERNLNGFIDEQEEEQEKEEELKIGDKVKIIGTGKATSSGEGKIARGIGWERQILKIFPGRQYPYRVGNSKGTTGYYKRDALKKYLKNM